MTNQFFVGVSGFSYASWRGHFYPKELGSEDFLEYYSKQLNSVEINSSFYAPPSKSTIESWAARAGQGFKFAFKAPKKITHVLKLGEESVKPSAEISESIGALGEKRGPLLFQLPPYLKQNMTLLENFLVNTSGIHERIFEFRHKSWLEDPTYMILEKYDSGFCVAETEDMDPVLKVTGGIAYFRLRKDAYESKAIGTWARRIKKTIADAGGGYVYLRHDETGENAKFALMLQQML
jgi:uncharacterized protein YecE (DUF72 family)